MALAACSKPVDPRNAEDILGPDIKVSEADLRTAQLLSLSNNGAVLSIADPYEMSVSCVISIQALSDQLGSTNVVTPEQRRALDAAAASYRKRALDTGKAQAEFNQDVERLRAEEANPSQQARLAVSCLRQLA